MLVHKHSERRPQIRSRSRFILGLLIAGVLCASSASALAVPASTHLCGSFSGGVTFNAGVYVSKRGSVSCADAMKIIRTFFRRRKRA
jgi:hypothetical protein